VFTKSFSEMLEVDISRHIKQRDGADYLPWAACKALLHEHGAEVVMFGPVPGPDGSTLRKSELAFSGKDGVKNRCYEVLVHIRVDGMEWDTVYPVMNGNNPVRDNSMNQLRVHNAIRRAFVKGVAEQTGLGFSLWLKEDDLRDDFDDPAKHNIFKIRERVEQKITAAMQRGKSIDEIIAVCGMNDRTFKRFMASFSLIDQFERSIQ